jgi:hypothetical protein
MMKEKRNFEIISKIETNRKIQVNVDRIIGLAEKKRVAQN